MNQIFQVRQCYTGGFNISIGYLSLEKLGLGNIVGYFIDDGVITSDGLTIVSLSPDVDLSQG